MPCNVYVSRRLRQCNVSVLARGGQGSPPMRPSAGGTTLVIKPGIIDFGMVTAQDDLIFVLAEDAAFELAGYGLGYPRLFLAERRDASLRNASKAER